MAIDPATLESIRNPLAGLSNIGAMYAKGVEMKQNRELMEMKQSKMDYEMADTGSRVMGAYSKAVMDAVEQDPTVEQDPAKLSEIQSSIRSSFPKGFQQFIPEETQPLDEIQRGYTNAIQIQKMVNPGEYTPPKKQSVVVRTDESGVPYKQDILYDSKGEIFRSPEYAAIDITAETELTKPTQAKAEERVLGAFEFRDSLKSLRGKIKSMEAAGENQFTVGAAASSWIGDMAEQVGAKLPKDWQKDIGDRQKMQSHMDMMFNAWRDSVTGKQASAQELKMIMKQLPRFGEGITKVNSKLDIFDETNEKLIIRMSRALKDGAVFVETKEGEPVYKDQEGNKFKLSTRYPLMNIPNKQIRYDDLLKDAHKAGLDVETAKRTAFETMINEGYDMAGYR